MAGPALVLLPGLHGTANLFARFVAAAPSGVRVQIQPLPNERPRDYEELTDWVLARLPPEPFILIAESFSGPLALLVAARAPQVAAIVLCVTFVDPPAPPILARIPTPVFGITPPVPAINTLLTGGDHSLARDVQETVRDIPRDVIAGRIAAALHADAKGELQRFAKPLLCISATRDWIVPRRCTTAIRALKPDATFVEIEGPHMLLQTRSEEVWKSVVAFLNRSALGDS